MFNFYLFLFSLAGKSRESLCNPLQVLRESSSSSTRQSPSWSLTIQSKSKRPGWILKIVLLVSLSVPLILLTHYGESSRWDRYDFFASLIATFEAIGESITCKVYHCFAV